MLDDQTIFEAKDVEADAWPEEVVFSVSEDIIAVFKDTDGVDWKLRKNRRLWEGTATGLGLSE
jgi:hypothetical protein